MTKRTSGTMRAAGLFVASMCAQAALAVEIADIAMVTEIKGQVDTKSGRLKKMDGLAKPCTITLGSDAKAVVFYFDGVREYTLSGPGTFEFSSTGLTMSSASGAIAIKRQDPNFDKKLLRAGVSAVEAGIVLRAGAQAGPDTSTPNEEKTPVFNLDFSWKMRPHQGSWHFRLADATDKILHEAEPIQSGARLPAQVRLVPDRLYRWEVSWIDREGSRRTESHAFRTLDAKNESLAAQLKPDQDAQEAARTLYGLWLRSVGANSLAQQYLSH